MRESLIVVGSRTTMLARQIDSDAPAHQYMPLSDLIFFDADPVTLNLDTRAPKLAGLPTISPLSIRTEKAQDSSFILARVESESGLFPPNDEAVLDRSNVVRSETDGIVELAFLLRGRSPVVSYRVSLATWSHSEGRMVYSNVTLRRIMGMQAAVHLHTYAYSVSAPPLHWVAVNGGLLVKL